jgi:hypothetical protein
MKILPLSFDSMGTRSMCTHVETPDVRILIDPGVALGPKRYGLPPHPIEIRKLEEDWKKIINYGEKADVLVITHYHYDHYNPDEALNIFYKKVVFVKDPKNNINFSQKKRAEHFLKRIEDLPKELREADGEKYGIGNTEIKFSRAVFHGTNPKLGYVTEVLVDDGNERFIHTSDVEGPPTDEQTGFIIENDPSTLFIDGPMTYMLGYRYSVENLNRSIENIEKIMEKCEVKRIVLDHHLLRDLDWKERMAPIFEMGREKEIKVETAAEFAGQKTNMLEARRKELYKKYPE